MPRNRKPPRRKRTPGPVHANALQRAVARVHKLATSDVTNQVAIITTALREFSAGRNCTTHWRSLADTANVAETFARMRICSGPDADRVVQQAQATLHAVLVRHRQRGTWTLHAAELEHLQWLVRLHTTQLQECDFSEFERAMDSTHHRIAAARAGNAPAGAIVIEGDIA